MNNQKKISIVIPVYNTEKYLDRCIQSIVNQNYKNLEIILVDDGSPDSCPKICDKWSRADDRIKVVHQENNGVSKARNAGIDLTSGDFIAFVDSDDMLLDNFSEFAEWAVNKNVDICYSKSFNNKKFDKQEYYERLTEDDVKRIFKRGYSISCCGKLFAADFIKNNKIYFEDGPNSEDLLWSVEGICKAKSFANYPLNFYHYEDNAGSATKTLKYKNFESIIRNLSKSFEVVEKSNFSNKTKKILKQQMVYGLYFVIGKIGHYVRDDVSRYIELLKNNAYLLIFPGKFRYNLIYYVIKMLGIKNAVKLFMKISL